MQALPLCERFFTECALPLFQHQAPHILEHAAFGLVGEGSECFGFDDDTSQDHDWGVGFCVWLPQEKCARFATDVKAVLDALPQTFEGVSSRMPRAIRTERVGLISYEDFYQHFLGIPRLPQTWEEWLNVPEFALAACTNGAIFYDTCGHFTAERHILLGGYPSDIVFYKLATAFARMAQTGQYNLLRQLARGETLAAMLCAARFSEAALSAAFLLNNRAVPFYKWAHRAVRDLPILGQECYTALQALAELPLCQGAAVQGQAYDIVEGLCAVFASEIRSRGRSTICDNWLLAQSTCLMRHVRNKELQARPLDLA